MNEISLIPNANVGNIAMNDGSDVILDSLLVQDCRLFFPKLPNVQFALQGIELPNISVTEVKQRTRYVDPNQIGEKVKFEPFNVQFVVDKYMRNWASVFTWMKRMTVNGTIIDDQDEPILFIANVPTLKFIGAWPSAVSGLRFDATSPQAQYVTCNLTLNYDYMDLIGTYQTIDTTYK